MYIRSQRSNRLNAGEVNNLNLRSQRVYYSAGRLNYFPRLRLNFIYVPLIRTTRVLELAVPGVPNVSDARRRLKRAYHPRVQRLPAS